MALVVYDRVQETTATTGTGSITLGGAVSGFQSFAVVGNGNTTFYCIVNGSTWEVGIGTYSTTGPTLARTTVLSNSSGNTSLITLSGSSNVFVTYPSEKSVNLDASGNVSPLGTIASGTWQGTLISPTYGGTGVTSSSGANSVVLRDVNQNVSANSFTPGWTSTTTSGGTTTFTVASTYYQRFVGSSNQTVVLPAANTVALGQGFIIDNDSSGTLALQDGSTGSLGSIVPGMAGFIFCENNGSVAGSWSGYQFVPGAGPTGQITWGTAGLAMGGGTISSSTWNGSTIGTAYGGTGLTSFTSGGAVYATSTSALTTGTLPIASGGTNSTATPTAGGVGYGTGTAHAYSAAGTSGNALISAGAGAPAFGALAIGTANVNVSGALTPTNGGTGVATLTGVAYGNGTSSFTAATSAQLTTAMGVASTSTNGYLSSTDWNTFNGKQPAGTYVTSVTGTAPVVSSGGTTPAISMAAATTSVNGYLTSTDWNTFNGKAPGVTFTSTYVPYGQGTTTLNQASNFTFDGTTQSAPVQKASQGFFVNTNTNTSSYSLASGSNMMSAGPFTVATGTTVTIATGSRWVVV